MSKKEKPKFEPCINISVEPCWKCKEEMRVAYYSDNLQMPYGPSNFTDKQIEIGRSAGCKIDLAFSKTMQEQYLANICKNCGAFKGDFFYHDYAYVPGDIQYFLDEDDNVIKVVNNE